MRFSVSFSVLLALSLLGGDLSARSAEPAPAQSTSEPDNVSSQPAAQSSAFIIPGPQRSFLRMAGISQKIKPEEVLPLLSRNVFTEGYQGSTRPTEFLVLLRRYVVQAKELSLLASQTGMVLRVTGCNDAGPLLRILGYRIRPNCGTADTTLLTEDPERAFLAIDSGFPLPALEQTLQGGKPFQYPYSSDGVPVLFSESDWTQLSKKNMRENSRDLLETILFDPSIARLYWAFSRLDSDTSRELKESVGLGKLLPYAAVLDFYGRELCIENGSVVVPGGSRSVSAWKDLVGASPASPASFVPKLLAKDKGWLAAYFDVLSRIRGKQQEYFTDPARLHLFYTGLRAPDPSAPATRGSFRPAPWMLLLATRLHLDDSGQPLVPGNLQEWNDLIFRQRDSSLTRKWARQNFQIKNADELDQNDVRAVPCSQRRNTPAGLHGDQRTGRPALSGTPSGASHRAPYGAKVRGVQRSIPGLLRVPGFGRSVHCSFSANRARAAQRCCRRPRQRDGNFPGQCRNVADPGAPGRDSSIHS